jgi:hypothetical protein
MLPPKLHSPVEMVEAEFASEVLVVSSDCLTLVDQFDAFAQEAGRGERDEVVFPATVALDAACAEP